MRRRDDDAVYMGLSIDGPLFAAEPAPPEPGPFDRSYEMKTSEEVLVAAIIWRHQGRANPVSVAEIAEATAIEPRFVKTTVQALRNKHHCAIGSKHHDPPGYYWIVDDEDLRLAVAPFHSQILAMWDTLQVLDTRGGNRKLLELMREKI